jgi:hypothetical protein
MIDSPCFCQSKHRHVPQRLNAAQSARAWTLDPRPVASWLGQAQFRPRKPRQCSSQLDPLHKESGRRLDR